MGASGSRSHCDRKAFRPHRTTRDHRGFLAPRGAEIDLPRGLSLNSGDYFSIFGLQERQQQCLSFFSECVKYWEKANMRWRTKHSWRSTLFGTSSVRLSWHPITCPELDCLAKANDNWSNSIAADLRLQFGPKDADDMIRYLRSRKGVAGPPSQLRPLLRCNSLITTIISTKQVFSLLN